MGPMKRPAAAVAKVVEAKRTKTGTSSVQTERVAKAPAPPQDPLAAKCEAVAAAIAAAEGFPPEVRELVCTFVRPCLGTAKESRHAFQEQGIEMVAEVLNAAIASSIAKRTLLQERVAASETQRGPLEAAAKAAGEEVGVRDQAVETATAALAESVEAVKAMKAAHAAALQEQRSGDAEALAAEEGKAKLVAAHVEFVALRDGGEVTAAKLKALEKAGKEQGLDAHMFAAAHPALNKPAAERGEFDNIVLDKVHEELGKVRAKLEEAIAAAAPLREARAAKVSEALAAIEAAKQREASCTEALANAQVDAQEANRTKRAADKALKDFERDTSKTAAALESTVAEVQANEAVLATFRELVEPPPAPAEQEPGTVEALGVVAPMQVEEPAVVMASA